MKADIGILHYSWIQAEDETFRLINSFDGDAALCLRWMAQDVRKKRFRVLEAFRSNKKEDETEECIKELTDALARHGL